MGCGASVEPGAVGSPPVQGSKEPEMPRKPSVEEMTPLQARQKTKKMQECLAQLTGIVAKGLEEDNVASRDIVVGNLYDMMDDGQRGNLSLQQLQRGFHRIGWAHSPRSLKSIFKMPKVGGWIDNENEFSISRGRFVETFRTLKSLSCFKAPEPEAPPKEEPDPLRSRKYPPGTRPLLGYTVTPLTGVTRRVKCIRVSPPLSCLAICLKDACTAQLLSSVTGATYRTFSGHCSAIFDICISSDKRFIATASRDNSLMLWDATCGHLVKQFRHPGVVTCCAFTESNQILTGSYDSMVRRYDVGKGLMHTTPPQSGKGVVITLATVKQMAAVTRTREMEVEVIHVKSMKSLMKLPGHDTVVWVLHFTSTGGNLLSLCEKYLKVWQTRNMEVLPDPVSSISVDDVCYDEAPQVVATPLVPAPIKTTFLAACFLPISLEQHIIVTTSRSTVSIFTTAGAALLTFAHRYPIYTIVPCSDEKGERLYAGDNSGNILVIDVF